MSGDALALSSSSEISRSNAHTELPTEVYRHMTMVNIRDAL